MYRKDLVINTVLVLLVVALLALCVISIAGVGGDQQKHHTEVQNQETT